MRVSTGYFVKSHKNTIEIQLNDGQDSCDLYTGDCSDTESPLMIEALEINPKQPWPPHQIGCTQVDLIVPKAISVNVLASSYKTASQQAGIFTAKIVDNNDIPLTNYPVLLLASVPGIGTSFAEASTDDEGCVCFPIVKNYTNGTSMYQLKAGNRSSMNALVDFDDKGRIESWGYHFKNTNGILGSIEPIVSFKYNDDGSVEISHNE